MIMFMFNQIKTPAPHVDIHVDKRIEFAALRYRFVVYVF